MNPSYCYSHAAGLLEHLRGGEPNPKKILEAMQTLFAAMNEVQELIASRFGPKTRVVFTKSPGYASMPPALQFVHGTLILIAESNAWWMLMAAPNRELEPVNLEPVKWQQNGQMCSCSKGCWMRTS